MSQDPWSSRAHCCTMFNIINFTEQGQIQVYNETVKSVLDKNQIAKHLQGINPTYGPVDPSKDPLHIEANGYCRLVFAFDASKPNYLFQRVWPFALKPRCEGGDASAEFDCLTTLSRGDLGHKENQDAVAAFFIDDMNTKKDPYLIPYNLHLLLSQDARDENAYLTPVTIDPNIKNQNG